METPIDTEISITEIRSELCAELQVTIASRACLEIPSEGKISVTPSYSVPEGWGFTISFKGYPTLSLVRKNINGQDCFSQEVAADGVGVPRNLKSIPIPTSRTNKYRLTLIKLDGIVIIGTMDSTTDDDE